MKFLKESFLKFNTYTQIQIGVIGVAACIFFICVCLLSIISLILLNTAYTEIEAILELKENDQINGVSIYIDTQINIATELSKIYQFNTRAFLDNNLNNTDFINNFKNKNLASNYITNSDNNKDKLIEKCFPQLDPNNLEYSKVRIIFSSMLKIFNYTQSIKFYKNNNDPMYKVLSYYSSIHGCLISNPSYQNIVYKKEYNDANFFALFKYFTGTINKDLGKYIKNYNLNSKKNELAKNLNFNPISTGYMGIKGSNVTEIYVKNQKGSIINLITLSLKFRENFTNNDFFTAKDPFTDKDLKDILVYEFSDEMIDKLLIHNLLNFPGFKTLVQNSVLLGTTSCGIMQKIFYFYENITDGKINLKDDRSCFLLFDKTKNNNKTFFENYIYYFNSKNPDINKNQFDELIDNYRRFIKIPVAYDRQYPNDLQRAIYYKILRFTAADIPTRILINSFFTVWLRPSVFIMKSYSLIENSFKIIYTRFSAEMLKIISTNIIIIIITSLMISYLTFRVSKSIGDPIDTLINVVKNINPNKNKNKTSIDKKSDEKENNMNTNENDEKEKEKNLDNIKFEDDNTINKFFEICKKLIRGGLSDENLKGTQIHYKDEAYNNISYMKSNNLIVQEDKILVETKDRVDKIFNHDSLIRSIKSQIGNENYQDLNNIKDNDNINNIQNKDNFLLNNSLNLNSESNLKKINVTYDFNEYDLNKTNKITKRGEIKEILVERQKTIEKNHGEMLFTKKKNSIFSESSKKVNFSSSINLDQSTNHKSKHENVYPLFKEKKSEIEVYFQNTKSTNIELGYDGMNFLINSNLYSKKIEDNISTSSKVDNDFDKVITKNFTKSEISRILDLVDKFYNRK